MPIDWGRNRGRNFWEDCWGRKFGGKFVAGTRLFVTVCEGRGFDSLAMRTFCRCGVRTC